MIETIEWKDSAVVMIDQRLLPIREVFNSYTDYREVAEAIRTMVIRGAPAIGVAAAMGIALGVRHANVGSLQELDEKFQEICKVLSRTRPTAVNLFWAVDRMKAVYQRARRLGVEALCSILIREAHLIKEEDIEANRQMGRLGQELVPQQARILTHCNAGLSRQQVTGRPLG
jgi:methylthioribose-1-phosphate isomerase